MATPVSVAEARYREGQRLADATEKAARSLWGRLEPKDLSGSWRRLEPLVTSLVMRGQKSAAEGANRYVDRVLATQGIDTDSAGDVQPDALAGRASDGRGLRSLLYEPVIWTKGLIARGATPKQALATGGLHLSLITQTQIQDAGRVADGIAVTARPHVGGYVRVLSTPSCPRCAILAGRWYRWSAGFKRHPHCDCRHLPTAEANAPGLITDPMQAYREGHIVGLTDAQKQALDEGADFGELVNVRRKGSVFTAGGKELSRKRVGRSQIVRPTPEQIYRDAKGSRDEAVRLLRRFGYIK